MLSLIAALLLQLPAAEGRALPEAGAIAVFAYGNDMFALVRRADRGAATVRILTSRGAFLRSLNVPSGYDVVGVDGENLLLSRRSEKEDLMKGPEGHYVALDRPFSRIDIWFQHGVWLRYTQSLEAWVGGRRLTAPLGSAFDRFAVSRDHRSLWVLKAREQPPALDRYPLIETGRPKSSLPVLTASRKAVDFAVPGSVAMTEWLPGQLVCVCRPEAFGAAELSKSGVSYGAWLLEVHSVSSGATLGSWRLPRVLLNLKERPPTLLSEALSDNSIYWKCTLRHGQFLLLGIELRDVSKLDLRSRPHGLQLSAVLGSKGALITVTSPRRATFELRPSGA